MNRASAANHPVLLQPAQGGGMMVRGAVVQHDGKIAYQLSFTNQSQQPLGGIAIQVIQGLTRISRPHPHLKASLAS
jgi:hypothetical protein